MQLTDKQRLTLVSLLQNELRIFENKIEYALYDDRTVDESAVNEVNSLKDIITKIQDCRSN